MINLEIFTRKTYERKHKVVIVTNHKQVLEPNTITSYIYTPSIPNKDHIFDFEKSQIKISISKIRHSQSLKLFSSWA